MPAYKASKTCKWYTSFYYTNWNYFQYDVIIIVQYIEKSK